MLVVSDHAPAPAKAGRSRLSPDTPGRNRRTISNYINGLTTPGTRKPAREDPFEPFVDYVTCRLREDPHLWARTLCDELEELGYRLAYPTLTRQIRDRGLRPVCEACYRHRPGERDHRPSGR